VKIRTTLAAFKMATYVGNNPNQRGPKILRIDNALNIYWQEFDGCSRRDQIALTAGLFMECKNWLKLKSGKSHYKKKLFGPDQENFVLSRRRTAIASLAEECLDALDALEEEAEGNDRLLRRFDRKKVRTLGTGLRRPEAKSLSKGYEFERQLWVNSGKTHTYGGSGMTGGFKDFAQHSQLKRVGGKKKLEQLTYTEFERIGDLCNTGTVRFLKKQERIADLIEVDEEGRLCNATSHAPLEAEYENVPKTRDEMLERLLAVKVSGGHIHMYAMDSYGNLFARWVPYGSQLGGHRWFNHSSLNSGREVTCAGMLCVTGGRLLMIDNFSGHYKPSRLNLYNCVKLLQADGVDLSETLVDSFEGGTHHYFSSEHFLQLGTGPDLGTLVSTDF